MGVIEVLERIRQRVLIDMFDMEPIADPPLPRAEWPQWSDADRHKEFRLRVLSLNAWGLPVAPKVMERAVEIANAIESGFEVVVLQEIWHRRERNLLITRAKTAGFHYYHYFNPAIGFPVPLGHDSFGTGLLVLSKFPISEALFHSFALSGRPYALHEADFVANKGAGLLRLVTPAGPVDLYVTHLLANYNALGAPGPGDRYLPHRAGQSYELARFIVATNKSAMTIVCGDFNSPPDSVELHLPKVIAQLRDAFTDTNDHDGLTFATADNKFSVGDHPMRMDYVLYKLPPRLSALIATPASLEWQLVASDVFKGFFTDSRGEKTPLSDHFGVTAEFVFGTRRSHTCAPSSSPRVTTTGGASSSSSDSDSPVAATDSSTASGLANSAQSSSSPTARTCATTTCGHCDEVEGENTAYVAPAVPHSVKVLEQVQQLILDGRAGAIVRRTGHLRRSGTSFVAVLALVVARTMLQIGSSTYATAAIMLLACVCVCEYLLAFFFVTLECSTFTELANQVRLHLHAELALAGAR